MNLNYSASHRPATALPVVLLVACGLFTTASFPAKTEAASDEFASKTIDVGIVVRDVETSVKFYTESIGFTEVTGFSVPGDFATESGLTNLQPLEIRVLVLGEEEGATKIKLMQLPNVESKPADNAFIHSQLGYSYLTVVVTDTDMAMSRLKKTGVKPLAKGPVALPKPLPQGVFLTLVRDPDGNIIELVGPKGS